MQGRNYYYTCVKQDERESQFENFRALGAQKNEIFVDITDEKSSRRNNLRLLQQNTLRAGDTLTIPNLYCLSDMKKGLADELHWLRDHKICLRIADMPLTLQASDARNQQYISDLLYEILDATLLKEFADKRERQSEGIRAAQEKGVHIGRKPMERGAAFETVKAQWQRGEISLREAGRRLGVTHQTFKKWVEEDHSER